MADKTEIIKHMRRLSDSLSSICSKSRRRGASPQTRAKGRALLIELVSLTLEHGSLKTIGRTVFSQYDVASDLMERRAAASAIISAHSNIKKSAEAGIDVSGITAPCLDTAVSEHADLDARIQQARYLASKARPRRGKAEKDAPVLMPAPAPLRDYSDEALAALAAERMTPVSGGSRSELDEVWREARRRRWTRNRMREVFG